MAVRDTQDALIAEFTPPSQIRDTQDVLIAEIVTPSVVRGSQDVVIEEFPFVNYMFTWAFGGFTPKHDPVAKQPLYLWGLEAERLDSIAMSGSKRSSLNRLIGVTTLTFPWVALEDLAEWKTFMEFVLAGGVFGYRPNANIPGSDDTAFSSFELISTNWDPKFTSFQNFELELKLKLVADL